MEAPLHSPATDDIAEYDVVVIGGALSGGATATLLLRQNPGIRVLILEKSARLSRRVGRSDSGGQRLFHGPSVGLTQYFNECHLAKQGLRFWFTNDEVKTLGRSKRARRALSGAVAVVSTRSRHV